MDPRVPIIDGDGHVLDDYGAIARFLPPAYKAFAPEGAISTTGIFPALDHYAYWQFRSAAGYQRALAPSYSDEVTTESCKKEIGKLLGNGELSADGRHAIPYDNVISCQRVES
jgi:hypothetical protein